MSGPFLVPRRGSLPAPTKIVPYGDSLTLGAGSFLTDYPRLLQILRPSITVTIGKGFTGATAAALNTDYVTNGINTEYISGALLIVWAGTNDLVNFASGTTAYNSVVSLCQTGRATGYQIAVMPMLPRSDAASTNAPNGFNTDRATFNGLLTANWRSFADYFINLAADSRIGDNGDEADPVYYNYHDGSPTDLVHLNGDTVGGLNNRDGGYAVVAALIHAGLPT